MKYNLNNIIFSDRFPIWFLFVDFVAAYLEQELMIHRMLFSLFSSFCETLYSTLYQLHEAFPSYTEILMQVVLFASLGAVSGFVPLLVSERLMKKSEGSHLYYICIVTIPSCAILSPCLYIFLHALSIDSFYPMITVYIAWWMFWISYGIAN